MNTSDFFEQTRKQVQYMQDSLVSFSTGGGWDDELYTYSELRTLLLGSEIIKKILPDFINDKRGLDQFWQFIKHKYSSYAERRAYLWESFSPVLSYLETFVKNPNLDNNSLAFINFGQEYIKIEWDKCLERLNNDPEGAITSARTLIESTCKHILDGFSEEYSDEDITKLYDKTAKCLNLAPSQHHEEIFRQILGGCKSVIFGLGALRNKMSDSHGKGSKQIRPSIRHAELAVNLAGTVAVFLLKTYTENKK